MGPDDAASPRLVVTIDMGLQRCRPEWGCRWGWIPVRIERGARRPLPPVSGYDWDCCCWNSCCTRISSSMLTKGWKM